MIFHPRFSYTHAMVRYLGLIESARAVVDVLPLPADQVLRLRQAARQRATRNSKKWREDGFIQPVKADVQRIRTYTLAPAWSELLQTALFSATVSTS